MVTVFRYLLRMLKMDESLHITNTVVKKLLQNNNKLTNSSTTVLQEIYFNNKNINIYGSMKDLINHSLHWHTDLLIDKNYQIAYIDAPKGSLVLF
jgi:NADH:ubiquinone oxidoreductase subunit D